MSRLTRVIAPLPGRAGLGISAIIDRGAVSWKVGRANDRGGSR
jgi:hypothetical protein